jgi:hypothetical protein
MQQFSLLLVIVLLSCAIFAAPLDDPVQAISEQENITLPEIAGFSVSPSSIDSGSIAILTWDVRNATIVNIDHGIGSVSSSGQISVNPPYSTTYKLTVSNDAGTRTRYITLYVEIMQANPDVTVDADPVTGRNSEVDLSWEDYCLSRQYQVQIARDPYFTLKVYDSGSMDTADTLYPALLYPPGNLEAGHTYYWRVRVTQAATGQRILSGWSEPKSFTVRPGFATRADYASVHAFTPSNGCAACPVKPVSFSWSGYQGTSKYRFLLARDSQLQDVVVDGITSATSYGLSEALEYDTSYYWQVTASAPIPSDPSSVFTFRTESAPKPVTDRTSSSQSSPPVWAIVVMVVGAVLIIAAVVFTVRARPRI